MTLVPKIAFFGGTFDPIHQGHLEIAQKAVEKLKISFITGPFALIILGKSLAGIGFEPIVQLIMLSFVPFLRLVPLFVQGRCQHATLLG